MLKKIGFIVIVLVVVLLVNGALYGFTLKHFEDDMREGIALYQEISEHQEQLIDEIKAHYAEYPPFDYSWLNQAHPLVAHACGGIDGQTYTNSLEAFEFNYNLGHRVFEVDFTLTSDGVLVAAHDERRWRKETDLTAEEMPFTAEAVRNVKLHDQYTSMSAKEVIEALAAHPDAWIITDSKFTDKASIMAEFSQLVYWGQQLAPEALERVIPQIYNEDMLAYLMAIYPFRSVVYTVYNTKTTDKMAFDFCREAGIQVLVYPKARVTAERVQMGHDLGVLTSTHTEDDPEAARKLFDMGVDVLYTNFLNPADYAK